MTSFNKIQKYKYYKNKESDVVSLSEYILFEDERTSEKYLVFKFHNNLEQYLLEIKFEVSQYNENGDLIETNYLEYNKIKAGSFEEFVPDAKMKANPACASISIEMKYAKYERVCWTDGKFEVVKYTKDQFRKDFSKESSYKEYSKNKTMKDEVSFKGKRKIKIKNITKLNLSRKPMVFSIIIGIILLAFTIATAIYHDFNSDVFTIDGFDYKVLNKEEVSIVEYDGNDDVVTIPSKVRDYEVISIAESAFEDEKLTEVEFVDNIIIEKNAFKNCEMLETISGSSYVTSIYESAFEGCTSLKSVSFENVMVIGEKAFKDCLNLNTVYAIKATVSNGAFENTAVNTLHVSTSLSSSFKDMFGTEIEELKSLSTIVINKAYVASTFFNGISNVKSFNNVYENPTYGYGALDNIASVTNIDGINIYNGKIISIDSSVENVIISNKITDVAAAFDFIRKNKSTFKTLTLENNSVVITSSMLQGLRFEELVINYANLATNAFINNSIPTVTLNTPVTNLAAAFGSKGNAVQTVNVNTSVTSTTLIAFTGATTINVGSNVRTIDNNSFANCVNLSNLSIPVVDLEFNLANYGVSNNLSYLNLVDSTMNTLLPSNAIVGYNNLYNIEIGAAYKTIDKNFIAYCESLNELRIPSTITRINNGAIGQGCYNLYKVELPFIGNTNSKNSTVKYSDINLSYINTGILNITSDSTQTLSSSYLTGLSNLSELRLNLNISSYESGCLTGCPNINILHLQNSDNFYASSVSSYTLNLSEFVIKSGNVMNATIGDSYVNALVVESDGAYFSANRLTNVMYLYLTSSSNLNNIKFNSLYLNGFAGVVCLKTKTAPSALISSGLNYELGAEYKYN